MLPNFLGVGVQKAGTTSLHSILTKHSQIYLPSIKETSFFAVDELFSKGLQWYEKNFFSNWKGEKAVGEICTSYIYFEYVAQRIHDSLGGDIKIILMLRNPVDRAYSHYNMSYKRGLEKENFETALDLERTRLSPGANYKTLDSYSYIRRGLYAEQIERYLDFFPLDKMLFLVFEEFIKDQNKTINEILQFLDLEDQINNVSYNVKKNPAAIIKNKNIRDFLYKPSIFKNTLKPYIPLKLKIAIFRFLEKKTQSEYKPHPLTIDTRLQMMEYFLDDIHKVEKLINRDLSLWYETVKVPDY